MAAEETKRFRTVEGRFSRIEPILETVIPLTGLFFIFDFFSYFFNISLYSQQYLGIFLGLVMALLFLKVPVSSKASKNVVPWYDWLFALLSLIAGLYVLIYYPKLALTMGVITSSKVVFGIIVGLLVLEGTRRIAGWPLVTVIVVFIIYARFGYLLPSGVDAQKVTWGRLINQLFLGSGSIYGVALRISALVVFSFILYAHALFGTGGGDFLFKLSEGLMGRFRGGSAKVSILASCFFGSLSGSAVANVASTGTITIPLMKRSGYPSYYASAVEAVASTGGTITPPVMGAAAFLIAEFVGVPYSQVVLVAIVPALLYYLGLFVQVDLNASKENRQGLPPEKMDSLIKVLLSGWPYIISLLVLVYCLFVLYLQPQASVLYALVALLVLVTLSKSNRKGIADLVNILRNTSRGMLEITVICAAAGIIIGVVNYTGLGFTLSRLLTSMAGDSLFILALVGALVSIILGMGVPGIVSYMVLAVLVAPALVQLGVQPIIAHFFIFYFGLFSFITPPFCLAVYTAASIGGANMTKTAVAAMKLALAGFIVPFIFLYNPALVFLGSAGDIAGSIISALLSVVALGIALENYFLKKLGWMSRILFLISAICLILPGLWTLRLIGVIIFTYLIIYSFFMETKAKARAKARAKGSVNYSNSN